MNQVTMFHETIYDALSADITAAGGFKVVAAKLWPTDTSGPTKLRNAVNPDQPHKLCPDETLAIKRLARESGSTATIDHEAQIIGYQITWVDPKDEGDQLRRDYIEAAKSMQRLAERITRADERVLKAVK